jgi:predicted Fe-S protein YdhL (DUF1289 family)
MVVTSPCVKICAMDPASGLCRGCGRTLDEIARWGGMSEAERREIMDGLASRLRDKALSGPCDAAG